MSEFKNYLDRLDKDFSLAEEAQVSVAWTPEHVASQENGWAIPGLSCECDIDHRCNYHDDRAEEAFWLGVLRGASDDVVIADSEFVHTESEEDSGA